MIYSDSKQKAALISIGSNTILIASKFVVGIITNSISIISEAAHSFTDLLAAIIAYFSVKKSSDPADIEHQYGHGKFEDLSGLLESALILLAAGYIVYESVEKIISGKFDHIGTTAGIIVMLLSVIMNIIVSSHLFKVAHKTDSMAILADAEHLRTDIYTSAGVLLGLILIKLTGLNMLDPIVAIFVALFIIKVGIELCLISINNLLDISLPEEERTIIKSIIEKYFPEEIIEIKDLKTRRAGPERLIEFILIIPKNYTVEESHNLCDRIEESLKKNIRNAHITIHMEPCDSICPNCVLVALCSNADLNS